MLEINHAEYGLPDEIALNIQNQFQPMLNKMVELENEFNEVLKLPIADADTSKKAKELRWKYVKIRTGTEEIHKSQKAFYLNGCKFIDGWKNAQKFASQGKEEKLLFIENYLTNLEKERKQSLHNKRFELIKPLSDKISLSDVFFGDMEEDVWQAYFEAKQRMYSDIIKSEQKAEADRKERERLDALELKRKLEISQYAQFINSQHTKEGIDLRNSTESEYQSYLDTLKVLRTKYELERERFREEAERLRKENEAKEQQMAAERAKAEAERKALEKKIEEEKRAKAKIEAQIKLKEKEEKAAQRKAKLASDKDKLESLAVQLESLTMPQLKNPESENIIGNVVILLNKVCVYIREKSNNL